MYRDLWTKIHAKDRQLSLSPLTIFFSISLSTHFSISPCLRLYLSACLSLYLSVLLYFSESLCLFLCVFVSLNLDLLALFLCLSDSVYLSVNVCPSLFCVYSPGRCISVHLLDVCLIVCLSSPSQMSLCLSVCLRLSLCQYV